MAFIEQNYFGKPGKEAAGLLWASVGIVGSTANYIHRKTEPTRALVREMFWYEVGNVTQRVNNRYVRPMRSWLR